MSNSNGAVPYDDSLIYEPVGIAPDMNEIIYGAAGQSTLSTGTDDPGNGHNVPSSGTTHPPFQVVQTLRIPESGQSSASNQHQARKKGQKRKEPIQAGQTRHLAESGQSSASNKLGRRTKSQKLKQPTRGTDLGTEGQKPKQGSNTSKNLLDQVARLKLKSYQMFVLGTIDGNDRTQYEWQWRQLPETKELFRIEQKIATIRKTCKGLISSQNQSNVKKEFDLEKETEKLESDRGKEIDLETEKEELLSKLESLKKQVKERDKEASELLKRFFKRTDNETLLAQDIKAMLTDQVEETAPVEVPLPVAKAGQEYSPLLDSSTATLEVHTKRNNARVDFHGVQLCSLSPRRFNKDQAGPSQYVDDDNDELVEEFIKRLDAFNRTLTTSEFEGLDKDLKTCTGWSIPKSLEIFAIKIQKACNKTATFDDLPVLITLCATMKEMNKVQRLEQVNKAGLLRWAAAINRGAESGFKLKSAKEHLRYIAYAYFGSKAGDEKLKIIGERLKKLEAKYKEIKMCVDAAQGFQGSFCLSDGLFD